jgi:hypothetical protein
MIKKKTHFVVYIIDDFKINKNRNRQPWGARTGESTGQH